MSRNTIFYRQGLLLDFQLLAIENRNRLRSTQP
jgi:hypothetical protein